MRRFSDLRVQQYGCLALASRDVRFADGTLKMSMVEAVVAAMRRSFAPALLCRWGCQAIFFIAEQGMVRDVSGTGACKAVVAAMQAYPSRCGVQVDGVAALFALSRHDVFPEHRAAIIAAGGRDVVAAALRRYCDWDEHLRARAQNVLESLDKFSISRVRGQ
jgi:hypothetical protein